MEPRPGGWRADILGQLKQRNRSEVAPFQTLLLLQARLAERGSSLQTENAALLRLNETLKEEKVQLEATLQSRTVVAQAADSHAIHELQLKMFNLQEELTELHRRKGENAQQVIDLSVALKAAEKELVERQKKMDSLEAQLVSLTDDIKFSEAKARELEETNQLLKDEYQALQLALSSTEEKFRTIHRENQVLVLQIMELKAQDADRMNLENDLFMMKKQQIVQIELAEAAREQKGLTPPEGGDRFLPAPAISAGTSMPTKVAFKFDAHDSEITSVRWDFAGRVFATAGFDRKIKIWEISQAGQPESRGTLVGSNNAVMSVDFDSSSTMVVGASNDYATRIWTVEDQRLRHVLTGHSEKVMSAKFFVDSNRVVSGSHDRTLKIWDLRSKACIATKYPGSSCNDVVTTELTVISAHYDKKVRFWDTRSSAPEPAHEVLLGGKVASLDLTPGRTYLAICSRDDRLKVLDLRMNTVVGTYTAENFHVGCDWSRVSFSPDGEFLAAGGGDGGVYVWNVLSGSLAGVLRAHSACVNAVSWHPGGSSIASVEKGKTCVIWSDYL